MVCRLGGVAALGGGCPQVGVVCLADVSLSALPRRWALSDIGNNYRFVGCWDVWQRLILRISDIWPPEMPKLVGMWPLISLRLVKGSLALVLSFPGVGLMGAPVDYVAPVYYFAIVYYRARLSGTVAGQTGMVPMPASAQNLRMMTGGDARAGQGVNGQTRTPLTPAAVPAGAGKEGAAELRRLDALGIVTPGVARERVEDNLAKMWQANLTEWYEENLKKDNLKKEENPAVGENLKKEENPAAGDNLKKEENPAVGDNLKGHRWATPAGWGMDTMEENPKGDNLKKEENPADGDNLKGHRWATLAGWGMDTEEENPKGDNLKKEENPAEGDNLMREGAEENPDFGENLDGGMEDHAGDGNAAQAVDIGAILLWLRWLGLASFLLTVCANVFLVAVCLVDSFEFRQCSWDREVWKGRQAQISWMQVIIYAWGDLEGLACQANWKVIVDRLKRWVGMKEGQKRGRGDIDLGGFF
ncbi:hypothetical protein PAPYR_12024 [Paratrimastix pyriformis]|uniref:Uncharacterized protein n=1 Tax=Paratrimastix pyriformis TaxID=342808 RepID=A0ABQ8U491_9EUKA|nr:hypothetical protein PAPYR_12024 [Paratrimastix pyriformis]